MDAVKIVWRDIVTWSGWNQELIDAGLDVPLEITTLGYVVRKTKDQVTISDTTPEIGNITVFPRGCIVSITKII